MRWICCESTPHFSKNIYASVRGGIQTLSPAISKTLDDTSCIVVLSYNTHESITRTFKLAQCMHKERTSSIHKARLKVPNQKLGDATSQSSVLTARLSNNTQHGMIHNHGISSIGAWQHGWGYMEKPEDHSTRLNTEAPETRVK